MSADINSLESVSACSERDSNDFDDVLDASILQVGHADNKKLEISDADMLAFENIITMAGGVLVDTETQRGDHGILDEETVTDAVAADTFADDMLAMDDPFDTKIPRFSRLETLPEEVTMKILEYVIEPDRGVICTNYWPCRNHGHEDAKALAKVSTSIKASLRAVLESWGSHPEFTYPERVGGSALRIWREIFRDFGLKSRLLEI